MLLKRKHAELASNYDATPINSNNFRAKRSDAQLPQLLRGAASKQFSSAREKTRSDSSASWLSLAKRARASRALAYRFPQAVGRGELCALMSPSCVLSQCPRGRASLQLARMSSAAASPLRTLAVAVSSALMCVCVCAYVVRVCACLCTLLCQAS